ncbi:hypothetical protein E2C01_021781 [Portunus trituberculatus]|uniref:Uncharacterized protein n=1 Tax=Portunus trituberculatus TaxID=210409 RepID=A0A5B7E3H2_PORTR|nr:hypothetical protein [Portunus trituberculatus]
MPHQLILSPCHIGHTVLQDSDHLYHHQQTNGTIKEKVAQGFWRFSIALHTAFINIEQFLITYASNEQGETAQPLPVTNRTPRRSASSSEKADLEMDGYHHGHSTRTWAETSRHPTTPHTERNPTNLPTRSHPNWCTYSQQNLDLPKEGQTDLNNE